MTKYDTEYKVLSNDNILYSLDETCPICGAYTPDGQVCNNCNFKYSMLNDSKDSQY